MTLLPWLLLASTLAVRWLLARHDRRGFYLDIVSVAPWLAYYAGNGDYVLMAVPLVFGWLDIYALRSYWRSI